MSADTIDPANAANGDTHGLTLAERAALAETVNFLRAHGSTSHGADLMRLSAAAARLGRLDRAVAERPTVSVILQPGGRVAAALCALAALARHRAAVAFDIIVCGSGRAIPSADVVFTAIPWLTFVPAQPGEGPGAVLERARHRAKGTVIVLLDVRTDVLDGWLDATLDRLDRPSASGRSLDRLRAIGGAELDPRLDRDLGAFVTRASGASLPGTLLIVDHYVPEPDRDAGSRSMMDLIASAQALGWSVLFWPFLHRPERHYVGALRRAGVEVLTPPWVGAFDTWMAAEGWRIDLVLLCRPTVAPVFLPTVRQHTSAPIMFYGHDLHASRMRREADVLSDAAIARDAESMAVLERNVWRSVDVVLYPSADEVQAVGAIEPVVTTRAVLPFCFDEFRPLRAPPATKAIVFVAGFAHGPNVDAARFLVHEILPLVRAHVPDVATALVGSYPTQEVLALAADGIEVTGAVSATELADRYARARVAVVPLRFGAGVKLKVVEALHEGVPLVTTPTGAQGIAGLDAVAAVMTAPHDIADAIVRLLVDDEAWVAQAERQLHVARQAFTRETSTALLADAILTARDVRDERQSFLSLGPPGSRHESQRLLAFGEKAGLSEARYIDGLYRILLRRPADEGGLAFYMAELTSGRLSREDLIGALGTSEERHRLMAG